MDSSPAGALGRSQRISVNPERSFQRFLGQCPDAGSRARGYQPASQRRRPLTAQEGHDMPEYDARAAASERDQRHAQGQPADLAGRAQPALPARR